MKRFIDAVLPGAVLWAAALQLALAMGKESAGEAVFQVICGLVMFIAGVAMTQRYSQPAESDSSPDIMEP